MNGHVNFISFHINGKEFKVHAGEGLNSNPNSVLVDFIRNEAGLTGTKFMCREGGCGACVCVVKSKDPVSGQKVSKAINSCLVPVFSCDGWDISTVERLGNHQDGYDIIQNRLVGFGGTQCGFCTPGMIMSMYGLMKSNKGPTSKEIEDNLDGNVCRCTGFRPILDAFKSLASDVPESIKRKCADIEESTGKACPLKKGCIKAGKCLKGGCSTHVDIEDFCSNSRVSMRLASGQQWIRPTNLNEALDLVLGFVSKSVKYRLVAGNTSTGVFKNQEACTAYMDINGIVELREHTVSQAKVVFGGGVTLSVAIELLKKASEMTGYEYGAGLAKHWQRIANVPVRNAGTIAGNLMIKHGQPHFPSDIFLTLEAIGARLTIVSVHGTRKLYGVAEFLKLDMNGSIIVSIHFPPLPKSDGYVFRSYKITKRYQNAHAYVNGAMLIKLDSKFNVTEKPRICFGGINPSFIHAASTETYLTGKSLSDIKTLEGALDILDKEVEPNFELPDASPEYRKTLARNLLYKTILGILGSSVSTKHTSGALDLERQLTSGKQVYDYKKEDFPITQPIQKLEAATQCSGEAEYVNDIQGQYGELFGAFVVSTVAKADLKSIDASEALKVPGVVRFISEKDIPGKNNYMVLWGGNDEIFVKEKIKTAGQPLGLIVAESRAAAFEGVKKVKVIYVNVQKPILTIKDALKVAEREGTMDKIFYPPAKGNTCTEGAPKHLISGEVELGGQYHFQMEPHTAICIPKEGGMDVYSATQWLEHVQVSIASMLGVQNANINVQIRRLGGAYGSKISRSTLIAAAAALGAHLTNKPVRVVLDLETNMNMIGKRPPYWCTYEVGFDDTGKIQTLKTKIAVGQGSSPSETELMNTVPYFQNAYDSTGWEISAGNVMTNTTSNTYCRGPGTTQGIALVEYIMEHIAHYLKQDALDVRTINFIKPGDVTLGFPGFPGPIPNGVFKGENPLPKLIEELKVNADYYERKKNIAAFNKAHRWMKRGFSLVPVKYYQHFFSLKFPCFIAIYQADGSVAISHSGIEMGQGINTKVAQAVSHGLGIPMDKIKVKPVNNVVSANSICTGGAVASELVCFAALKVCQILKDRLAPIKAKLEADVSWEKLISAAYNAGIDLKASYQPSSEDNIRQYDIWGLNLTEVEVDMLTGEFKIARADLVVDAGTSISPEIDIGQVEGAFVMGLGLWTMEKLQYHEETGQLLTNNTWEYKVPFAKDIPEDFRVKLLCNTPNPVGVLGSKATGEPPLCMSIGVVFALKQAIDSARQDAGNFDYYQIDTPITPEHVLRYSLTSNEHFKL